MKRFALLSSLSVALMLSACGSDTGSDGPAAPSPQAWDGGDSIQMPEVLVQDTYGTPQTSAGMNPDYQDVASVGATQNPGMTPGEAAGLRPTPGAMAAQMALPGATGAGSVEESAQNMAAATDSLLQTPLDDASEPQRESAPLAWIANENPDGTPVHPAQ